MKNIKFKLGKILITPNAEASLNEEDVLASLRRHASGDWGICDARDWSDNDRSLAHSMQLFSPFKDRNGKMFWIFTEADRSMTLVLLDGEH